MSYHIMSCLLKILEKLMAFFFMALFVTGAFHNMILFLLFSISANVRNTSAYASSSAQRTHPLCLEHKPFVSRSWYPRVFPRFFSPFLFNIYLREIVNFNSIVTPILIWELRGECGTGEEFSGARGMKSRGRGSLGHGVTRPLSGMCD